MSKKKNHSHPVKKRRKKKVLKGFLSFPFILCDGAKWKMSIFHRETFMSVLAHGNTPGDYSLLARPRWSPFAGDGLRRSKPFAKDIKPLEWFLITP